MARHPVHNRADELKEKAVSELKEGRTEAAFAHFINAAACYSQAKNYIETDYMRSSLDTPIRDCLDGAYSIYHKREKEPVSGKQEEHSFDDIRPMPKSSIRLNDIAGLDDVKDELKWSLLFHDEYKHMPGFENGGGSGILMYGPPGCGKTFLGRAASSEIDAPFYYIKGSDVFNMYYGQSSKYIEKLFKTARSHDKSVIFLDEIDIIAPQRSSALHSADNKVVSQLLVEMDGVDDNDSVFVMGATNRPEAVDSALLRPGRLAKSLLVPTPDEDARKWILDWRLSKKEYAPHRENIDTAEIAGMTEKKTVDGATRYFSGADVRHLVKCTSRKAAERGGKKAVWTMDDVKNAIADYVPSLMERDIKMYTVWKPDYIG